MGRAARWVIGARRSPLSRAQAEWVGRRLSALRPDMAIEYRFIASAGDQSDGGDAGRNVDDAAGADAGSRPANPLSLATGTGPAPRPANPLSPAAEASAGGQPTHSSSPAAGVKGLFTEDIQSAVLAGSIDMAVHSLKDLPAITPDGVELSAIPAREDPRDVLVLRDDLLAAGRESATDGLAVLQRLPLEARVGTSSLRRSAQLRACREDLDPQPVRGNVGTRLEKLNAGRFEALVLAAAGLRRLGVWPAGTALLEDDYWLPAPGQGALAVQCRTGGAAAANARIICDPAARAEVTAERALLALLEGGCRTPVAARAVWKTGEVRLRAAVYDVEGGAAVCGSESGDSAEAAAVGRRLARRMLGAGAARLIERARRLDR